MNHYSFDNRLEYIKCFYSIIKTLEQKIGKKYILADCNGRMKWPERGVYFFFEINENRSNSGGGLRVVRIGTHALILGGKSTLWGRLRTHRGTNNGDGNHRGSVFRKIVGEVLINKNQLSGQFVNEWGEGNSAPKNVRDLEKPIEQAVSGYIRQMPFLWVDVGDPPGPNSGRRVVECNAIALLSNFLSSDNPIDEQSPTWLGKYAKSEKVKLSGMWNSDHVDGNYDPRFLEILESYVDKMK